jgi:ribosome-associated protein
LAQNSSARPALTDVVIDALEDIKAKDIKLINVAKITTVSDYIAIASADSTRQTRALAHNVIEKVKEAGYSIYGNEGEDSGEWVLVDCGDVVVHIMQPAVREYYKLEELWQDGIVVFPRPKAAEPTPLPATEKKATAKKGAADRAKKATGKK